MYEVFEAEQEVIGSMVVDSGCLKYLGELSEDDFENTQMRTLFATIQGLYMRQETVDLVTVHAELGRSPNAAVRGLLIKAAVEAAMAVPTTANIRAYIKLVKERSARRKLAATGERLREMAADLETPVEDVVSETENAFKAISSGASDNWVSVQDVLVKTFLSMEKRMDGAEKPIKSGINALDARFYGFLPGEVTVLGARPGVGKSALGAYIATEAAISGAHVGIISLEMAQEQYGQRLLARASGVNLTDIRNARKDMPAPDLIAITEAMRGLSYLNIEFLFGVNQINKLRAAVEQRVNKGMNMLVVDYLQLIKANGKEKTEYETISKISLALKELAMHCQIPVLALAQLNREVEKGGGYSSSTPPKLSNLRGSGSIEQDADNVMMIHQPTSEDDDCVRECDKPSFNEWVRRGLIYTVIFVRKQRQGQVGAVPILFDPKTMRYITI
jgi:replicative DNA helicase